MPIKLSRGFKKENKTDVANLNTALTALKMKIVPKELAEKKIEAGQFEIWSFTPVKDKP